jgi:8-oxo-dGTP pyrophosphatase MutT (NUDIX family)
MAGMMRRSDGDLARLHAGLDRTPDPRPGPDDRLAAVLVPLVERPEPSLVFTQRADELPRHAGEISFPGGLAEDGDAGLEETALRETREELGLDPALVRLLGALPPIHTSVSRILVVPFVGLLAERPPFEPSAGEIAQVLEYPVRRLASAEALVEWRVDGHLYRGFAYEVDGHTIWGATARMLHDLLVLVRSETPWVTSA